MVPIGRWVLHEACRQARAWQVAGLPPLNIAVNVSSVELRDPGFVAGIRATLKETRLEPRYLELEITERALVEDAHSIADVLRELRDIGVLLALDNFGTGYSSLNHLRRFPIDTLKIDQSFVRDLTTDENGTGIVTAVVDIGKLLQVQVVAEGVETRQQLELVRQLGCTDVQGFYYSRPLPLRELAKILAAQADAKTAAA